MPVKLKLKLERISQDITGLKQYLLPILETNDPVTSWKILDSLDFLEEWEEEIKARIAVLELNKPSLWQRIVRFFKGD